MREVHLPPGKQVRDRELESGHDHSPVERILLGQERNGLPGSVDRDRPGCGPDDRDEGDTQVEVAVDLPKHVQSAIGRGNHLPDEVGGDLPAR